MKSQGDLRAETKVSRRAGGRKRKKIMKTTEELIRKWDEIEERIRTLEWARSMFLEGKIAKAVSLLADECGFKEATAAAKDVWLELEAALGPRDAAGVLLGLRSFGARIEQFVTAYESPEGRTVGRALSLLDPQKPDPSAPPLPAVWLN